MSKDRRTYLAVIMSALGFISMMSLVAITTRSGETDVSTAKEEVVETSTTLTPPRQSTTTTEDPKLELERQWYTTAEVVEFYKGVQKAEDAKARAARASARSSTSSGSGRAPNDFLACVAQRESRGIPTAVSPGGQWRGKYQFSQSTWNATAQRAGRSDLVGVPPEQASEADQDAMALVLYQWQGTSPWAGGSHPC